MVKSSPCTSLPSSPFPSLVLALRSGGGWGGGSGEAVAAETCSATAAAAAAAAAATAAAEPLKGLLELNSLHFAPKMVIILDIGILGFFFAIIGLQSRADQKGDSQLHLKGIIQSGITFNNYPSTPNLVY